MMIHNKPNYIADADLIATEKGWENIHTGEVLVAIPNLKSRMENLSQPKIKTKGRGRPKNKK